MLFNGLIMFNRGIISLQIMLKFLKPSEMGPVTYKHILMKYIQILITKFFK